MLVNPFELTTETGLRKPLNIMTNSQAKGIWDSHIQNETRIYVNGKRVLDGITRVKAAQILGLTQIEVYPMC